MNRLALFAILSLTGFAAQKTVTVNEGTNIATTISPDRRTIVLDLQGSLWSLPFAGGVARQITDPLLEPSRPHYSPKGDLIAFQAYKGGTFHIWTMKPDGTRLHQLTEGHGDDREPCFSPDGSQIAFSSDRAFTGSYDIWVVDLQSGTLTQRTSSPEDEYEPSWSPDGSEIAFVSGAGAVGTTIQAMDKAGTVRTLARAPSRAHFNSPSWSPDGKRVAYIQFLDNKSTLMIAGESVTSFDDVFPFPATWLDENRLLYTANGKIRVTSLRQNTEEIAFEAQFTLNRPTYQRKHYDLDSKTSHSAKGIVGPALSPDGKRVLFQALNQLWVMNIGGATEQLTHDTYYKEDAAWSPDGKLIAYSSDATGNEELYVHDLATHETKQVTADPTMAKVSAAWSPDAKRLAYQDQNGATYILDLESGKSRRIIAPQFAPSKPSWSPSGNTIAISAVKPYSRRFREGTSQILTADVQSGAQAYTEPAPFKSITTRGEDGPVYSPDGSSMAFVMDSTLWIRPVDKNGVPVGAAHQINHEVTDAPTWSGDSKKLLYLSNGKLRLIPAAGGAPTAVALNLNWHNATAPQRTVIHAGHFWDGLGREARSDVDITILDGRIQSIEPHKVHSGQVIDASNLTVIPGLWEAHTHNWLSGKFYGDKLGRLWLAYGITSLQSQCDSVYRAIETRESFASGDRIGPRYFASGEAIDGERIYYNMMRPVMSDAQLELELQRAQSLDYDLVKTYVRLPHAVQQKVVRFAHEKMGVAVASHYLMPGASYGMDVMTHVSATARLGFPYTRSAAGVSYNDMRTLLISSGMADISTPFTSAVLYRDDPTMVDDERLKALNTPWDQAVLVIKRDLSMGKKVESTLPGIRAGLADTTVTLDSLRKEEDTVAAILRGGGTILAGTDSPIDNVATALHLNLRAQVKFGLEPWQALQTATMLPAKTFGVAADLGTLEPGKLADLVIVAGNPLKDIKDAARVRYVMKGGKLFTIGDLMAPFVH